MAKERQDVQIWLAGVAAAPYDHLKPGNDGEPLNPGDDILRRVWKLQIVPNFAPPVIVAFRHEGGKDGIVVNDGV